MSRGRCVVAVAVACVLTAGGGVFAETIWVPDDYATIQGAIDAAVDGDEIAVRPGTYNETIDFIGKAVRLYSTDGAEVTVIDATGLGTSVVKCVTREEADTILEGLTITGGGETTTEGGGMRIQDGSPTVVDCVFYSNGGIGGRGMGMYIENGSPMILSCVFEQNETVYGSGVGLYIGGASPVIIDGVFLSNRTIAGRGGGLFSGGGDPRLVGCTFAGNSADSGAGASCGNGRIVRCVFESNEASGVWSSFGGGLSAGSTMVIDSQFIGNSATTHGRPGSVGAGGGAYGGHFVNCVFQGNTVASEAEDDGSYGGAVVNGTLVNCSVSGNRAASHGGGATDSTLVNCTVVGNFASVGGGGLSGGSAANCIVWDNGRDQIRGASVTYTCVQSGYPGVGNIDSDPLCDADGRPQAGSPCIDAGVNNAVPADTSDLDEDGDTAERLPLDLDGNPRFADDLDRDDSGCGLPVIVDMGAFEYQGIPVHPILIGDVDGSGFIDFADLLDILAGWGQCHDDCCLADVNFDREVNFEDILLLLSNWS